MEQKAFYEIERPRKTAKIGFLLVEVFDTDEAWHCQHFITNRKHCTQYADEQCEFCGIWTCRMHFDHTKQITIDGNGFTSPHKVSPCTACSTLCKEDLLKVRALRLELNRP